MAASDILKQTRIFKGILDSSVEKVMLLAKETSFPAGSIIFSEGEWAEHLFIIQEGVLDLTFNFRIGEVEQKITIDTNKEMECVGWSALIPPHHYTLDGVCREPLRALTIDGQSLIQLFTEDPSFGLIVMSNIAELVATRMKQLQSMFIHEVRRGVSVP